MKLIDILVEELPKCGGWDAKWHQCAQDGNGEVCFFTSGEVHFRGIFDAWSIPPDSVSRHDGKARFGLLLADDYQETIITREQYEAALAVKNDGWIEWGGGKRPPVSTNTVVDVKLEKGYVQSGYPAGEYSWEHVWQGSNIIAYRLHQPQEAEQAEADDEIDLNECIGQDAEPVWSGECLPPIGAKVVFFINPRFEYPTQGMPTEGREIEVVAHKKTSDGNDVAVCYWDENGGGRAACLVPESLMPAKSETERKREDAAQALCNAGGGNGRVDEKSGYGSCWFDVYDAIAAGKIPGVKLED